MMLSSPRDVLPALLMMFMVFMVGRAGAALADVPPADTAGTGAGVAPEPPRADAPAEPAAPAAPPDIDLGAELVFNYTFAAYDEDHRRSGGTLGFNRFGVRFAGSYRDLRVAAKYFWQGFGDYVRYGYLAYQVSEELEIQLGVTHQPFGVRPFVTNAFIFGLAYLVGMEDDADAGIKLVYRPGDWDIRVAFFKSDEYGGSHLVRWGSDIVAADVDGDGVDDGPGTEINQGNGRLAYRWRHGGSSAAEIGVSARLGQLQDPATSKIGYHWAAAAHLDGRHGPFSVKALVARYGHRPAGDTGTQGIVAYGVLGEAMAVAEAGTMVTVNAAWNRALSLGPVEGVTVYNDFSILIKELAGSHPAVTNISGLGVTAGPVFAHVDVLMVKNHPFFGAGLFDGLAAGASNDWTGLLISTFGVGF